MLGLAVAGAGAVAMALIWHNMVVPFDRMRELSEELNDRGYKITVRRARMRGITLLQKHIPGWGGHHRYRKIGEQKTLLDAIRSRSRLQHNAA